jgi:hypothetical protein
MWNIIALFHQIMEHNCFRYIAMSDCRLCQCTLHDRTHNQTYMLTRQFLIVSTYNHTQRQYCDDALSSNMLQRCRVFRTYENMS